MDKIGMLSLCLFIFVASQAVDPEKPGESSLTSQSLSDHLLGAILGFCPWCRSWQGN